MVGGISRLPPAAGRAFNSIKPSMNTQKMLTLLVLLGIGATACSKKSSTGTGQEGKAAPAATAGSPANGAATTLAVRWTVGDHLTYRMDFDQHSTSKVPQLPKPLEQTVVLGLTYSIEVLKETPGGGRELELEFRTQEMDVTMGGQPVIAFDSKEKSKGDRQNPVAGPFRKTIGSRIRYQMEPSGKLAKILNLDEWRNGVLEGASEQGKQIFLQTYNEGYLRQLVDYAYGMPGVGVREGDSWPVKLEVPSGPIGTVVLNMKSTLRGAEERQAYKCVRIESTGTMTSTGAMGIGPMANMKIENGRLTGTSWFDPSAGMLVESGSSQTMRIRGGIPGGQGAEFTSDVSQKVTVALAEYRAAKK